MYSLLLLLLQSLHHAGGVINTGLPGYFELVLEHVRGVGGDGVVCFEADNVLGGHGGVVVGTGGVVDKHGGLGLEAWLSGWKNLLMSLFDAELF